MKKFWILGIMAILLWGCYKGKKADLVLHNARIHTLNPEDIKPAEALAVKDGKVIEVGPEREILNKYRAERKYDAASRPVYPGFNDAHAHFLGYGLSFQKVDLTGTNSWEEVLQKVKAFEKRHQGDWIQGRGWDQGGWENDDFPDNIDLNEAFPDRPVLLKRIDGHAAVANQEALKRAGLTLASSINGGKIEVEEGELTGLLLDKAVGRVSRMIPPPSPAKIEQALLKAQEDCFRHGLTSVTDAGVSGTAVDLMDELHKSGDLKIRINAMLTDSKENFDRFLAEGPYKTERLNVRSFKFYMDGALGSRGALLLEPYSDIVEQMEYGLQLDSASYFRKYAQKLAETEFQMCTHAIGDSANRSTLDIYGKVLEGTNDKRWRIEHAQVVHPKDQEKFKQFTVIPSVQPTHATSDKKWAEDRLGPERLKHAYPYRSLLDQNGWLPLGTDFPVEDISPLETFYAAVTRKDESGDPKGGFMPDEALTREQALRGITFWPAMAAFEEMEKGTLQKGKFADFVILEKDILKIPEKVILDNSVIATFVNGEKVYEQ